MITRDNVKVKITPSGMPNTVTPETLKDIARIAKSKQFKEEIDRLNSMSEEELEKELDILLPDEDDE